MSSSVIAHALRLYLEKQVQTGHRLFVRLDGFDDEVYMDLLAALGNSSSLAGRQAKIRTTGALPGYEGFALEPDTTATWHRNNVPNDCVLLLLFNALTSDSQSLKDIFSVTETRLADEGLRYLVSAAFASGFELNKAEDEFLTDFICRFRTRIVEPQLRSLAAFLVEANRQLSTEKAANVKEAIAASLPYLNLFRCRESVHLLNMSRGDRLLDEVYRAARLGDELIEERKLDSYLTRLGGTSFEDERGIGGLGPEEKREAVRNFLTKVGGDNRALQIDWSEVKKILFKKAKAEPGDAFRKLAKETKESLDKHKIRSEDLPLYGQEVLNDLEKGTSPDADSLDRLSTEYRETFGTALTRRLRKLAGVKPQQTVDFVTGLTVLGIEIISAAQDELQTGWYLRVGLAPGQFEEVDPNLVEALAAFRTLYGGIEAHMPAVRFELEELWSALEEHVDKDATTDYVASSAQKKVITSSIRFRLSLCDAEGNERGLRADLAWEYGSDSPAATTLAHVLALSSQTAERPYVPIYKSCQPQIEVSDFDLSRPLESFGRWYDKPVDLRKAFEETVSKRPGVRPSAVSAVSEAVDALGEQVAKLSKGARKQGILAAGIDELLQAYEVLLQTSAENLTNDQESTFGFRVLNQAWVVGNEKSDHWALLPLLHPLKLLWWRNRLAYFNALLSDLMDPDNLASMVDETRFRRELPQHYSSSNFPAVLTLLSNEKASYFLPLEEREGYELYRPLETSAVALGLNTELDVEDEGSTATVMAARSIARVVRDYVETYPFVKEGIEICLYECRNGALPGRLVEELDRVHRARGWNVRLSVQVHTTDRGATTFRRVNEWLLGNEEYQARPSESYFPRVTLKVLETDQQGFFEEIEDTDVVVLADVLNEHGQEIEGKVHGGHNEVGLQEFVPLFSARQTPFGGGDLYRRELLNASAQPEVLRRFYNAQYAGARGQAASIEDTVRFSRISSLLDWQQLLSTQHRMFNWVICYDTIVDRFLLKNTFPGTVQVIRYSLGLGPKQQHNLTVSSAASTQEMVVRRLMGRLREMLVNVADDKLVDIANRLVEEANELSGDVVLRAAGPGAFLNELIGLVLAKHLTERRYLEEHQGALTAWVYLDDYAHWFSGKYPDLVFVAVSPGTEDRLNLHVEVVEAKCVSEATYGQEALDAQRQAVQGLSRLSAAWSPESSNGARHLDAHYWYDQMVRAVVANLSVEGEQEALWERFYKNVEKGDFRLDISGHSWVFCHDGQGAVAAGAKSEEGESNLLSSRDAEPVAYYHHVSRAGLHEAIRDLVGTDLTEPSTLEEATVDTTNDVQAQEPARGEEMIEHSTEEQSIRSEVNGLRAQDGHTDTGTPETKRRELEVPPAEPAREPQQVASVDLEWLAQRGRDLDRALHQFNVRAQKVDPDLADVGPSIVRFKVRLKPGERLNRLQNVAEDVGRELALPQTPLIANIPGSIHVGVDLPRSRPETVPLLPLLEELPVSPSGELPIVIGQTPDGRTVVEDLSDFPHLLVAGATNSGKSVFLRSLVLCLLSRHRPESLRLLIVDPKRTDFSFFNKVSPYLIEDKVVTDQQEARDVLLDLVHHEMPRRQEVMAGRAFAIKDFNRLYPDEALTPIVAVIDEYAQLVSIMSKNERDSFERDLMSLAAVARSTGIHLVLATQRPSHDVVTGTLRANLPASIAFKVANATNSRIVIDEGGAENLLGRGDMLFMRPSGEVLRLQAAFIDPESLDRFLDEL